MSGDRIAAVNPASAASARSRDLSAAHPASLLTVDTRVIHSSCSLSCSRSSFRCSHCGAMSVSVLYASTFHEHTCTNLHVWRIY